MPCGPLSNELQELVGVCHDPPTTFSDFEEVLKLSKKLFEHILALNQVFKTAI